MARLDEERGTFDFRQVRLIHPPPSQSAPTRILDEMLAASIPGIEAGLPAFFRRMMEDVPRADASRSALDASSDLFYRLDQERGTLPDDPAQRGQRLHALIGVSCLVCAAGML